MQPSNTSHNEISFSGVLQPLVDVLARKLPSAGRLSGQGVSIPRKDIKVIIALDSENDIHLLIAPASIDSRFSKLDFKGMKIAENEWSIDGHAAQKYLDIFCSTGKLTSFKRPFLKFAEDVIYEISKSNNKPADEVYRTGMRWRKFWSEDTENEVTREWLHGIFGELLFLAELIEKFGSKVINSWTGPTGKDHDFQSGTELAVEIKTSADVPLRINCNIRQLDNKIFKKLFIACYRVTNSENGTTLPDIVRRIEKLIGDDENMLDKFYDCIKSAGYMKHLEETYSLYKLNYSDAVIYPVDSQFPKITEESFVDSPDHRISGIRYSLQLTGLKELKMDEVADDLGRFAQN